MAKLELRSVTKSFGDIIALNAVSFRVSVDEGEFFVVVGPKGASCRGSPWSRGRGGPRAPGESARGLPAPIVPPPCDKVGKETSPYILGLMRYDPAAPYVDLCHGHDERMAVSSFGFGVRVLFDAACELNRA